MPKHKPDIKFELFLDPLGGNISEVEFPGYNLPAPQPAKYSDGYDQMEDEEDEIEGELMPAERTHYMMTSLGPIPLTEYTNPSKIFNFWVGNSNFDLTPNILDVIEKTEGVEILNIFTRYRFRVAIGKMFDSGKVMRDIRKKVISYVRKKKNAPLIGVDREQGP